MIFTLQPAAEKKKNDVEDIPSGRGSFEDISRSQMDINLDSNSSSLMLVSIRMAEILGK